MKPIELFDKYEKPVFLALWVLGLIQVLYLGLYNIILPYSGLLALYGLIKWMVARKNKLTV